MRSVLILGRIVLLRPTCSCRIAILGHSRQPYESVVYLVNETSDKGLWDFDGSLRNPIFWDMGFPVKMCNFIRQKTLFQIKTLMV